MIFELKGPIISILDGDTLIQNPKVPHTAEFRFDEAWDGLTRDVTFRVGNHTEMVRLGDDNICVLPSVLLELGGLYLYVMIDGFSDHTSLTTDWCIAGKVLYRPYIDDGEEPELEPSDPGTYEELKEAIGDISELETESTNLTGAVNELREAIGNGGGSGCPTATDAEIDAMIDDVFSN